MSDTDGYFLRLAAAYVRGQCSLGSCPPADESLLEPDLDELDDDQFRQLIEHGRRHELRLHRFKSTMGLRRVRRVLGVLQGIAPSEQLDIGSGRGAFLWPLMTEFPDLPVTAVDRSEHRAADLHAVSVGGVEQLTAMHGDATELDLDDEQFDLVTMLEVLEHIPQCLQALQEVCRVSRRFVLLSVPSKEDDNPEHIHLFDESSLSELLAACGVGRVRFEYVPGHLIAVANTVRS